MFNLETNLCIWSKGKHNAFTDLCRFNGQNFLCFREATNHVSPDGKIRVLTLDSRSKTTNVTTLTENNCDLRDPKLSIAPDGKLVLLVYAKYYEKDRLIKTQTVFSFSNDGFSWSAFCKTGPKNWWLWRISWLANSQHCASKRKPEAYGFAYNRTLQRIDLYKGNPLRKLEVVKTGAMSFQQHHLGYPNESDIVFKQNKAFALVRRDADTCTAQLGESSFPFKNWQWYDLGEYIGGPKMLQLNDDTFLIAGRRWHNHQLKTGLWTLDVKSKQLTFKLELESEGDNSYPGMVLDKGTLWLSYYSSHNDKKAKIYLAQITI